jgi:hypothetical protein
MGDLPFGEIGFTELGLTREFARDLAIRIDTLSSCS